MLGVLLAARQKRASVTYDLMEPIRPLVDASAPSLYKAYEFTKAETLELADGHTDPPLEALSQKS